jgi:uncharacterized protein (TIGR00299 family) protein
MRILYYDPFSGISGDMNLGALIDLGVPKDYLIKELKKLKVSGYTIEVVEGNRKGITGTKVTVKLDSEDNHEHHHDSEHNHHHDHPHHHENEHSRQEHIHNHEHEYGHSHNHAHEHNHHHEVNNQEEYTHEHHEHRNLETIESIIINSELSENVKNLSIKMFLKVAEAEAKIHGKPLMEVHFHEVGALDSIIDVIGSAICLDYLKVDRVLSSSVELGGGFVKCAHGLFPVPAPATAEILKGIPVKLGAVNKETTTPTGAAILAATVHEFTDKKEFTVKKIAYGIGQRDTVIPNVLRVYLGEIQKTSVDKKGLLEEEALILECNIDDMNPELYDYTMERLFELGAMDVFLTPIIMKKGRPGIKLSVLCCKEKEADITRTMLRETTTLGVRKYKVEKSMLEREFSTIKTSFGEVRIKTSLLNGEKLKAKPEYDDCKRLAKEKNVPIALIYEEVNRQLGLR